MAYTLPQTEQMDMEGLELGVRYLNINGDTVTATAAEINTTADVSSRVIVIGDVTTYAVLTANTSKTHVLEAIGASIAITLPAAAAGLDYRFIMGGIVAEADDWNFDNTAAAPYLGGLLWLDADAGDLADEVKLVLPDGTDDKMGIVNVGIGTWIHLSCDGTSWFVSGVCVSDDTPTFSTA